MISIFIKNLRFFIQEKVYEIQDSKFHGFAPKHLQKWRPCEHLQKWSPPESDVFIDFKIVSDFYHFQKISLVNTTFPMACPWDVDVYNIPVNVVHPSITCPVETPFFGWNTPVWEVSRWAASCVPKNLRFFLKILIVGVESIATTFVWIQVLTRNPLR